MMVLLVNLGKFFGYLFVLLLMVVGIPFGFVVSGVATGFQIGWGLFNKSCGITRT